ncbi:MAG: type II secretion system protein GspM [Pseudomonadota bacterium]
MKWPALTQREQRILALGALVAFVFLAVNVWPALNGLYQDRDRRIEALRVEVEREQRLVDDRDQWRTRREQTEQRQQELQRQVFAENTAPLLSASLQRHVREHATAAGLSINATRLAESLRTDDWLLVEQTLSFTLDEQSAVLDFLHRLRDAEPRVAVSQFSLDSNRSQYNGELTVVGFARTDETGTGTDALTRNE